jgi:SAM-dependent methyltransferase
MWNATKWPKPVTTQTDEQRRISDDWMQHFHQICDSRFSAVAKFNHRYVVDHSPKGFLSTLDVGAGLGEHINYEQLDAKQLAAYVALELRHNMANVIRQQWPAIQVCEADCQKRMPFQDDHFDRVIAIHVLEHLPNLPSFLTEAYRLLNKQTGRLLVVIPCEGGLGYSLGRRFMLKRIFERRYNLSYEPFIAAEHVNEANEILKELKRFFVPENTCFFPLHVPSVQLNLCIGLTLRPRPLD